MERKYHKDCKICGEPFETCWPEQIVCSQDCRAIKCRNYARIHNKPRKEHSWYKLRWSVLCRDNFTCQYCGRKAPEVIVQCDHIQPRSKGGKFEMENLITACQDCNIGKSDSILSKEQFNEYYRKSQKVI